MCAFTDMADTTMHVVRLELSFELPSHAKRSAKTCRRQRAYHVLVVARVHVLRTYILAHRLQVLVPIFPSAVDRLHCSA